MNTRRRLKWLGLFSRCVAFRGRPGAPSGCPSADTDSFRGQALLATALASLVLALLLLGCGASNEGSDDPGDSSTHEAAHQCEDGEDNDGDGFVDCADLDCRAESPACPFAPPLDRSVPTTIVRASEFLYTGDDPVQKDLDPDDIEKHRFAVVKGSVSDIDGNPLRDVRVSVKGHPEFGHTLTRFDGKYDLVVNGGGHLVLHYERDGYLSADRVASTNWLDYTIIPEVGMLERSQRLTRAAPAFTPSVEGDRVKDDFGERQPVVVFRPLTKATALSHDGSREPLEAFELAITEYPYEVPEARFPGQSKRFMPGARFDDNSLHYSLDFAVRKADGALAERVEFNRPVAIYVENFLGLPVGLPVRTEYYNSLTSRWETEFEGLVIEIVGVDDGIAAIDANGDGEAESRSTLEKLGWFEEELAEIVQRYEVGDTLWRTQVTHFSAFTLAWDTHTGGVFVPNELPKVLKRQIEEPSERGPVRVENLAVNEAVEVIGTPYSLVYQTDRSLGYGAAFEFDLPLLGSFVPPTLQKIVVLVEVGGELIDRTTYSAPFPKEHVVRWDGKVPVALGDRQVDEADRRLLQGQQKTKIYIGYGFSNQLRVSSDLSEQIQDAVNGPDHLLGDEVMPVNVLWRKHVTWLGVFDARGMQFGGFGLDVQHSYDSVNEILYYGHGDQRSADNALLLAQSLSQSDFETFSPIEYPDSMVVDAEGTLFITDDAPEPKVWKVPRDGEHEIILGAGASGEGGEVELVSPQGIAIDTQDGGIFLVDFMLKQVLKLHTNGSVELKVGPVGSGATIEKDLEGPDGIAVGPGGQVFLADYSIVYKLEDENLVPFAGHAESGKITGAESDAPEIFPAELIAFDEASGVAVDDFGNVFVSSRRTHLVYKITADGSAEIFAGTGSKGDSGDGGPAKEAQLEGPRGIALGRFDASVYISDQENLRIRRVLPGDNQNIMTIAGGGEDDPAIVVPATDAYLNRPDGLAFAPDGTLYVGAAGEAIDHPSRLIKIFSGSPKGFSRDEFLIPNNDGSMVFRFDQDGRHLATIDAITEIEHLSFSYTTSGLLDSCTDVNGLSTRVVRDSSGRAESIMSPFSFETRLRYDDGGALEVVRNDIRGIRFGYHEEHGLMKVATEGLESGNGADSNDARAREYEFDAKGRVKKVTGPAGDTETYIPNISAVSHSVTVRVPSGAEAIYELNRGAGSISEARSVTDADGVDLSAEDRSGFLEFKMPGGREVSAIMGISNIWGEQSRDLQEINIITPSGRELNRYHGKQFNFPSDDPNANFDAFETFIDPFAFTSYDQFVMLNNDPAWVASYDRSSRTWISRSPSGRTSTVTLDSRGRPKKVQAPGLAGVEYDYDSFGHIRKITRKFGDDERTQELSYGDNGLLSESRAPVDDETFDVFSFGYDESGVRPNRMTRQDGKSLTWRMDRNDNVLGITPAGRPEHVFLFEKGSQLVASLPASGELGELELVDPNWTSKLLTGGVGDFRLGEIRYEYDEDNRLKKIRFADGREIAFRYFASNRLDRINYSRGSISYDYGDFSNVRSVSGPDARLAYTYDDPLLTSVTWSGDASGTVHYEYDDFFRLSAISVNDLEPVEYTYDADFQMVGAGSELITRHADTGLVSGTALGNVSTLAEYDGFGDLKQSFALFDATVLLNEEIERDKLGRITKISETKQGDTIEISYAYNELGQLARATIDGVTTEYEYDVNGNRLSETRDGVVIQGFSDFQDRLEAYGDLRYTYSESGDLVQRVDNGVETLFEYDELGALIRVTRNDGQSDERSIEYSVDPEGRRIARRVDGSVTHRWLYQDSLNLVAEIAPNGSVTQFVYGSRLHVPDYMIRGNEVYRIVSDHVGSVRVVVDTLTGALAQEIDYDAYGNVLRDTNPGFQPFGFAGGHYDPDTLLVRFGARDYDPRAGRWLSKDPTGFEGGANFYAYAGNDPVNAVDPDGKVAFLVGLAAVTTFLAVFLADNERQAYQTAAFSLAGPIAAKGLGIVAKPVIGAVSSGGSKVLSALGSKVNTGAPAVRNINCPFCTAAGSSVPRLTSSQAARMAGITEGPLSVQAAGTLFSRLGLGNGSFQSFANYRAAAQFMRSQPVGTRFGVAFVRPGASMGHVVAGRNTHLGLVFRDFQASGLPWFRPQGSTANSAFYIFTF